MNDDEWKRWAATYTQEQRPIPPVMVRARSDRRRAIAGLTIVYALATGLALSEGLNLMRSRAWLVVMSFTFTVAGGVAVIVGAHVAMWRTIGPGGGTPLELLAGLERRHAGRRRLLRFLPWITALVVSGPLATTAADMIASGRFDSAAALGTLATCGTTVGLVWVTVKRIRRLVDRELRECAAVRQLLRDGDEAPVVPGRSR